MEIIRAPNYEDLSKKAAIIIASQLIQKPQSVLGLATGGTPEGLYMEIVKLAENGTISFAQVQSFNLDEYYGLAASHPQSYHSYMQKHLFSKVDIKQENIHFPDGMASDMQMFCNCYEQAMGNAGGIDLQILGIGHNGHIGFNEPANCFSASTHLVSLAESTIAANSRYFDSSADMPRKAITMGIGTIMRAKRILLIASASKRAAVERMLYGPVTPKFPASILQYHTNVQVIYYG